MIQLFLTALLAGLVLTLIGQFSYFQAVGILFAIAIVIHGLKKDSL